MRLVLLGPPGAGKGTHAADLSKKFDVPHISTGDILRAAVKAGTKLGREAKSYMEKGELVPDILVVGMVADRLGETDCDKGFILDGFPRNYSQARELDSSLEGAAKVEHVVYLRASEEVVLRRLSSRRVCRKCSAGFNVITLKPKTEGVCDACGGELIQRTDDEEQTVLTRLKVYERQTKDLIGYYREKGVLKTVDADLERKEGFKAIVQVLRVGAGR